MFLLARVGLNIFYLLCFNKHPCDSCVVLIGMLCILINTYCTKQFVFWYLLSSPVEMISPYSVSISLSSTSCSFSLLLSIFDSALKITMIYFLHFFSFVSEIN